MIARVLVLLLLIVPTLASAAVVNVELAFTPYVGDAAKAAEVETVPGTAAIFLNGVPYAEQSVGKTKVPVTGEGGLPPAVWLPVEALGPAVRKGKNTVRIEFRPADPATEYHARLSWGSVTDERPPSGQDEDPATKLTDAGKEEKTGKGTLVLERTITADFAPDAPWHHYPPVTALSDADKAQIAALVMVRVGMFKPDFSGLYRLLESDRRIDIAKVKEAKCLDAAYDAGVRLDAPGADQLEYVITNNPEVVVRRKGRHLYAPADASVFHKIQGPEAQMCAGVTLSLAFPPRLRAVHDPDGSWRVVY